jgi:hypothetical protein
MAWFKNPIVWLVIIGVLVITVVMIFSMLPKKNIPQPIPSKPIEADTMSVADIDDGETQLLDISQGGEDFGMYESSLSSWLSHHPSGSSVNRYMRHGKKQIHNVSSINTAMPPSPSDYIPYSETTRFQTPRHHLPGVNPIFNNHIRTSDNNP